MPVRKLSLSEWFLNHQLQAIQKNHFSLPVSLPIDVTRLVEHYQKRGTPPPYTAVIVKAIGVLAKLRPDVNRMKFRRGLGWGVLEFDHISVNLPIMMEIEGKKLLSAATIRNVDRLSVEEIRKQIQVAKDRRPKDLPVGKFIVNRRNTFFNRTLLRVLHWAAYRLPSAYEKRGGGLSFSSLLHLKNKDLMMMPFSYGPTGLTFCAASIESGGESSGGRSRLLMGVSFDHSVLGGEEALSALKLFSEILSGTDEASFQQLLGSD